MWRSIFVAIGLMGIIIGLESMRIDSAQFYRAGQTKAASFINPAGSPAPSTFQWVPQEWFPWVVLAAGTVVILYAFTLPRRWHTAGGGG